MKRMSIAAALAFAVVGSVAAQSGQSGTTSQPGTRQGGDTADAKSRTVTVTGCLQANDQAAGTSGAASSGSGTTGAASSASGQGTFLLTNARLTTGGSGAATTGTSGASGASGAAGASGTSGTSGSPASGASSGATTYTVEGRDLAQHVGHQVQLTGTTMDSASGGHGSGMSSGTGTTSGTGTGTTSGTGTGTTSGTGTGTTSGTGTTGSSGSGSTMSSGSGATSGAGMNNPRLKVTAVKMISATCSNQ